MRSIVAVAALSGVLLAAAPSTSLACGEGQFNMGQGMRYQGYLAPRPATVLVFDDPAGGGDAAERMKLYQGLERAGHHVTVVNSASGIAGALSAKRFDVVIADFAQVDAVRATGGAAQPLVLPVVERRARNAPELRSRFPLFLVDGASLGQYLKVINQAVTRIP